jgi:glycosyltransferase involved in cell wall biosynthesis
VTLAKSGEPSFEVLDGIPVYRLPSIQLMGGRFPVGLKNGEYRALMREIERYDADRVLVNTRFYGHSLEGESYATKKGLIPLILEHGSDHLTAGGPIDAAIAAYEHVITSFGKRYRPGYAGVSEGAARWLDHYGIETDLVVNNGIDAEAFRSLSSGRDFRSELGIDSDDKFVVYYSRLVDEKGPRKVVELAALHPDIRFAIAGAGPLEDEIAAAARKLRNLDFLGRLDRSDVSALLSTANLTVNPTSYPEGLPTTLLEAGAWGVVPIIGPVAGARDVLGDAEDRGYIRTAEVGAFSDAMTRYFSLEPAAKEAMSQRLRECVEDRFSWDSVARQLDHAFGEIERRA